jgi:putative inorganic carbon (HCO3(-)) transporter
VWRWALQAVTDFPLTGIGLGTFRVAVHRLYPIATPIDYDISHAHNVFLQVALDIGLPGLVAYLGLLGGGVWLGCRVARKSVQLRPVAIGFVAGIIGLHVYGLTDCPALGAKPWIHGPPER